MTSVDEAVTGIGQGGPDVGALAVLSLDQTVEFTQYIRYVLPLDGSVFWLRTASAHVRGSLHVTVDRRQNEDETVAVNRVVFSTGEQVGHLNAIAPDTLWVGGYGDTRFAFSRSDNFYRAAGMFHYVGEALYPALASQLVDVGDQLPASTLVVSNSLPLWLALYSYAPVWSVPPNPRIVLYPSYLVPDNLRSPYGVVHIEPSQTRSLAATPILGPVRPIGSVPLGTVEGLTRDSTYWQLCSDRVRLTFYGLTSAQVLDFVYLVLRYSVDTDFMGIMDETAVRDEKRTQVELGVIAMKKTVEFEVSYYQSRANTVARQLIESAVVAVVPVQTI